MINRCKLVREGCAWVHQQSKHVKINIDKLQLLSDKYDHPKKFTEDDFHQTSENDERALLQMFILDFMNFCFWPLQDFEYEHLATNVQQAVK